MNKFFHVEWGTLFRLKTLIKHTHTHTVLLYCLPKFPQSSSDKRRKATVILSPGRRTQTVDRVKTLVAFHVLSVTGRPVADDSILKMKRPEYLIFHATQGPDTLLVYSSNTITARMCVHMCAGWHT